MMIPITSPMRPASTSGPMKITSRMGSSSNVALTPEARPRCASGTTSGINPWSAPCAMFEDAWSRATPPIKARSAAETPAQRSAGSSRAAHRMTMRKTMLSNAPATMNGRRRPHREVLRSLSIPASGWISMATASPTTRTSARTLFFSSGAANSATR